MSGIEVRTCTGCGVVGRVGVMFYAGSGNQCKTCLRKKKAAYMQRMREQRPEWVAAQRETRNTRKVAKRRGVSMEEAARLRAEEIPALRDLWAHMEGRVYGRLTVEGAAAKDRFGRRCWICVCECGRRSVASGNSLRTGHIESCGCLAVDRGREANLIHGMTGTPEWRAWCSIRDRCGNPNSYVWDDYGGRGIKVCDQWMGGFEGFFDDMGLRPTPYHSIERMDVDGNYEPTNCIWADKTVQANNKRSNRFLTLDGRTQTATQWSRELGIRADVILARLRRGWSDEHALTIPPRNCSPKR